MADIIRTGTAVTSASPARKTTGLTSIKTAYTFAGTNNSTASAVVQMMKIPAGATMVSLKVAGGPAPSANGCTIVVGDGVDENRYLDSTSASGDMAPVDCMALLTSAAYTYSVDDTIDIKITAALTGTATGTFYMNALYTNDP